MAADERGSILNRIADLVDENVDALASLESKDNGKPVWLARNVDIPRVSKNLRFFASLATTWASEMHSMPDAINMTLRQPIGVVACISPWNLPLYLFSWKIAPALAVGNCVIGKPSEVTPATAHFFSGLCQKAGLPPGVLNVLHGNGPSIGDAITNHPRIQAISFTGGTTTGSHIAAKVAPTFKKLSLELGGKNPNLVFADCDFNQMMETTLKSSFSNQGQICLCGSRIYVEREIYSKFREEFVKRAKNIQVGDPQESTSQLGAVVSQSHFKKIQGCLKLAKEEGGEILCGGDKELVAGRCSEGWFIQPTVIEGLPADCKTNQEEIFGPVVTIQPFDTIDEAIALANGTRYGLSATVWTRDINRANLVAEQIDAGVVWVNCWLVRDLRTPFGGVKQSGVGREGGLDAFRFFTKTKNVCIKYK